MMLRSFGSLPLKKHGLFPGLDMRGNHEKSYFWKEKHLRKNQKFTQLYFNEADPLMKIMTQSTTRSRRGGAHE